MDGNKDEALRCLKIGKDALGLGDRTRALKFISKAQRLDPNLPIDDLLSTLESNPATNPSKSPEKNSGAGDSDTSGVRRRVPATGSSSGCGTDEQIAIVREIRRKKDYYDILGLEKSCSVEDVRKAYRKLSLKVHPDKNKAPGSEEAFKKISKAFQCLSVDENRKKYDVMGSDEPAYEQNAARRRHHHHSNGFGGGNGFFDGDVDAEEIFRNFFFGGGMNGGMPRTSTTQFTGFNFGGTGNTRNGTAAENGANGFNGRALLQLLPVLLILMVSFFPSNEPVYSLSRTYSYEHRYVTQKGVNFFVKSRSFEEEYPVNSAERVQIEGRVEHDYFSILSHNCRLESQRVQWGYQRATPNCDMLKKFDPSLVY